MTNPHNDEYYIKESFVETYPFLNTMMGLLFILAIASVVFSLGAIYKGHWELALSGLFFVGIYLLLRRYYNKQYQKFHKEWHEGAEE